MKKYLCLFLIGILGTTQQIIHKPYTKTGHNQFSDLVFVESNRQLLVNMTDFFIELELNKINPRFIGRNTNYLYRYEDGYYTGDVVFSRSNRTSEAYKFDYSLQVVNLREQSINVNGSLQIRGVDKRRAVEMQGTGNVEIKYSDKTSTRITEGSSMSIVVHPNKKITLRVAGEAKISSGFSKQYLFWICIRKGGWETVDIVTSFFELVEEDV